MNEFYNFIFPVSFQEWMQQVTVLDEALKGFIIGILVSAPMGPVGILTVQRTLNQGRWEGFATGVGASASDFLYALITGYGMHLVVDIIENPAIALLIKIVGSVLLFAFGVYTFRSRPRNRVMDDGQDHWAEQHSNDAASEGIMRLKPYFMSGFVVTVSNPLIMLLFLALFGQFTFIIVDNIIPQTIGYLFIIVGATAWWFALTWLINRVRAKFNLSVLRWLNRIIGIIVMVVSSLIVVYTLTGHSIPFHL